MNDVNAIFDEVESKFKEMFPHATVDRSCESIVAMFNSEVRVGVDFQRRGVYLSGNGLNNCYIYFDDDVNRVMHNGITLEIPQWITFDVGNEEDVFTHQLRGWIGVFRERWSH